MLNDVRILEVEHREGVLVSCTCFDDQCLELNCQIGSTRNSAAGQSLHSADTKHFNVKMFQKLDMKDLKSNAGQVLQGGTVFFLFATSLAVFLFQTFHVVDGESSGACIFFPISITQLLLMLLRCS